VESFWFQEWATPRFRKASAVVATAVLEAQQGLGIRAVVVRVAAQQPQPMVAVAELLAQTALDQLRELLVPAAQLQAQPVESEQLTLLTAEAEAEAEQVRLAQVAQVAQVVRDLSF
jgi:hypothetical protein